MAYLRYDSSDDSPNHRYFNDCHKCDKKDKEKDDASEWMQEVISHLYSHNDLDINKLQNALDELCHYFDMRLCPGDLMIERFKEITYDKSMV